MPIWAGGLSAGGPVESARELQIGEQISERCAIHNLGQAAWLSSDS